MATRRPREPPDRQHILEKRAEAMDNHDELSESDGDLDMIPRNSEDAISFETYYDSIKDSYQDEISAGSAQDDGESSGGEDRKRKRKRQGKGYGNETGERIAFSDDEDSDAAYTAFKKRKSEKRKQAIAATKRAKARVAGDKVVGKRPRTVVSLNDNKRRKGDREYGEETDEDEALMETTLPDYLRQRQSSWNESVDRLGQAGLLIPPAYDDVEFSDDERMANLRERPQLPNQRPRAAYKDIELPYSAGIIPAPIAQWLRDYQVDGASFLHQKFVYQDGGILGDDMGLGKTIQVIAFLTAAFGKTGDERDDKRMRKMRRKGEDRWYPKILIICPGSLMANWQAELNRWGWWKTDVFHGNVAAKEAAMAAAHRGRLEIMITTYTTYRMNASLINTVRWDAVIADECHIIKERSSDITKAMNDVNALCRIGLTGTAIQNKYEELWTLLNWTSPGKLGPVSVWKQAIALPLKLGQSHNATVAQLSKARSTATKLVGNLLPKFMLRRMKSLIAEQLPKKSDRVVFCPLTDKQAEAYNNFCDSELVRTIRDIHKPCHCGSKKKQGWCCYTHIEGWGKWQANVFPCLAMLQKLGNHLALALPVNQEGKEKEENEIERLKLACPNDWQELYRQRDNIMNFANPEFCGKWRVLKKLLKLWYDNGDKVLVFSHSVRLLKMLNMLFKATTTYNVSYLDGAMSYDDRQLAVDEYNSDPGQFVFLISTRAGGVGLNITSANKVVVADPNWNPAYDLQAQDRAYRIGQTRDVEVFRLVSAGTVEEIVYARQIYKQQQANIGYTASLERRYFTGVQGESDKKGDIFGLENLFMPQSENIVLREIVNKTNIAESRAGFDVVGLDLEAASQDEDFESFADDSELAAMSQLAQEVVDAPGAKKKKLEGTAGKRKKDPVQAILASAGVEYTHENAEVVGTSRMETKISSRAIKAGSDFEYGRERAFVESSQSAVPAVNAPGHPYAKQVTPSSDAVKAEDSSDSKNVRYRYRPAEDVKKRQFCSMARMFGYEEVTEFALVVEGWTQEQRRNCLERFYKERRRMVEAGEA